MIQAVHPDAWPVMTDPRRYLTEGMGYNVFMVTGDVIRTPGCSSYLLNDLGPQTGSQRLLQHG